MTNKKDGLNDRPSFILIQIYIYSLIWLICIDIVYCRFILTENGGRYTNYLVDKDMIRW